MQRQHPHTLIVDFTMAPRRKESSSDADSSGKTSPVVSAADTFPCKAFQVIQYCEKNDPNVASWSHDGSYFVVKDTAVFSSSHLPRYFKHSNFQSFNRQLNIYGFRTVKEHDNSDGSVAFRHQFFQRERRDLLSNIKRAKKQSGSYNDRFDEMQQQMDGLSEKLDLLISLVTANNRHVAKAKRLLAVLVSRLVPSVVERTLTTVDYPMFPK